jgi:hypothetical protein
MLRRGPAAQPEGIATVRVRIDAGYLTGEIAPECPFRRIRFAIRAKRNQALWRATITITEDAWVPAIGIDHTEIAVHDHIPDRWPAAPAYLMPRVAIPADAVSADPRSRQRQTTPKDQLALTQDGKPDHVHGYSFIPTHREDSTDEKIAKVEHHRHRTDIEALNRDSKLGAALPHTPPPASES